MATHNRGKRTSHTSPLFRDLIGTCCMQSPDSGAANDLHPRAGMFGWGRTLTSARAL
jgi:hypothetical protein